MPELEQRPDGADPNDDPIALVMDLARHYVHLSVGLRRRAAAADSEHTQEILAAAAGAYSDAAGQARETARYLDGDVDELPVAIETGALRRSDPDHPVPWRDVDGE